MRIAVVNEISTIDKNPAILEALWGTEHEIMNVGMSPERAQPELTYVHTGLLSALLLNVGIVDFVIGGCGTGIGFLNSILQYPGAICGSIRSPLDAWLFARINGGNCISLSLNQGYGWGGDINLRFILESLFDIKDGEWGKGYPSHRRDAQQASRTRLGYISTISHYPMAKIIAELPDDALNPVLMFPGITELLNIREDSDSEMNRALYLRLEALDGRPVMEDCAV